MVWSSGGWREVVAEPDVKPRPTWERRGKVVARPRLPWADEPGVDVTLPRCPRCGNPLVWRGSWRCDGCTATIPWAEYEGSAPVRALRALPREALAGSPIFSPAEGHNSTGSDAAHRTGEYSVSEGRQRWQNWLSAVEALTSWGRRAQAMRLRYRGARVMYLAGAVPEYFDGKGVRPAKSPEGKPLDETGHIGGVSKWHADREKGQAERAERIRACGRVEFEAVADDGTRVPIESRCGCWRLCQRCAEHRRYRLRSGIAQQRERALAVTERTRRKFYAGPEGRWAEKLLTFTVPHGESPAHDVDTLRAAWPMLWRKVLKHLRNRCVKKKVSVPWMRAMEVAPGETGGHAHLHVWLVAPYLEVVVLRAWWGEILETLGRKVPRRPKAEALSQARDARTAEWLGEGETVAWPVVDLRRGDHEATGKYVTKVGVAMYVTKGLTVQRVTPVHMAAIYESLEGARVVVWAKGWAPKKEPSRRKWRLVRIHSNAASSMGAGESCQNEKRAGVAAVRDTAECARPPPTATAAEAKSCSTSADVAQVMGSTGWRQQSIDWPRWSVGSVTRAKR